MTRSWRSSRRADVVVAVGVGVLQILGAFGAGKHQHNLRSLDGFGALLLAAAAAGLVVRRGNPAGALVVAFATTLAYWTIGYPRGPVFLALIVAFVNAVQRGQRRLAWGTLAAGYVSFLWLPRLLHRDGPPAVGAMVGLAAWLLVLAGAVEMVKARRERTAEKARTRNEEAKRRASEERLRIARELHDVLAHNISLINVQAGVALHLIDERPEQTRTALTAIKQASKEALNELRSVLDVLRRVDDPDDEAARVPTPGLADLDRLVTRTTDAGQPVRVEVVGAARPLPVGVDLAAYRIVQEALTNVTRHAAPATASVTVTYGEHDLAIEVGDDGSRPSVKNAGGGSGIPGMRERAAALGGSLEAGPKAGGGFRVRATLPLNGMP